MSVPSPLPTGEAAARGPVAPPQSDRRAVDFADLTSEQAYKLLSVAAQPRPIAWVSTMTAAGVRNLAPYAFFTVASRNPATVLISIGPRTGGDTDPKDTLANIRATGEFVVNIAGVDSADAVAASSTPVPPEVDEFGLSGATPVPSRQVRPCSVAEALISLECRVSGEVPVGTDVLVLGEVLAATSRAGVLDERLHVEVGEHPFLGRLAGPYFTAVRDRLPQRSGMGVAAPDPAR